MALRPTQVIAVDCFTLTLANGNQYRYCNADVPVSFYDYDTANLDSSVLCLGNLGAMVLGAAGDGPIATFAANAIRISGLKYSVKIGMDVDEQDVTISCLTPPTFPQSASAAASGDLGTGELGDMLLATDGVASAQFGASAELIEGVPFLQALRQGLFDGAFLQRDRAFLYAWGAPPIGTVTLFHGRISSIDKIGRVEAQVKVKSDLVLLDIDFPRNIYQAGCIHILFDSGCTLVKSTFAIAGTVGAGSTNLIINWANTADYFNEGTITFTSGELNGYSANLKTSGGATLTLVDQLPVAPQPGDTFNAYPGCNHTTGAGGCASFNNLVHFRGYPNVPPPATAF